MINSKNVYFFLGSALSQVFALLTSIYILKYASPDIYGQFSYFVSFGSILGSVCTLKFEQSIAISKDLDETQDKFALTIHTCFLLTLFFSIVYLPFDTQFSWFNAALIFILANTIALNASLQQAFLFMESHKLNGLLSLLYAALNFCLVYFFISFNDGLKTSYVFSYLLASVCFVYIAARRKFTLKLLHPQRLFALFKENNAYPVYILPGAISTILLTYGHPILIKHLFSESELGLFSISLRILLLPTILVSSVVSGLFRASISKLFLQRRFDEIQASTKKVTIFLLLTSIVAYSVLLLAIANMDYFLKGNKWNGIGNVAILLSLYAVAQYFYLPLSNIALVCEKKKMLMYLNLGQLVVSVLAYWGTYYFKLQFNSFLLLLSVLTFVYCIYACYRFVFIGRTFHND